MRFSRKLQSLFTDKEVFSLLSSFINCPIIDPIGQDCSSNQGIPPVMANILLNLYLSDLDHGVSQRFPKLFFLYERVDDPLVLERRNCCQLLEELSYTSWLHFNNSEPGMERE